VDVLETVDATKVDGHASIMREFLDCMRTGATPETNCADNLKSLAMVFRAIESAERGEKIRFNV
jgi:predicted dehydrogenase